MNSDIMPVFMKRYVLAALFGLFLGFSLASFFHQESIRREKAAEEARLNELRAEVNARLQECRTTVASLQESYLSHQKEQLACYSDPAVRASLVHTSELPVLAIGDSVMLGAKYRLEQTFPNGTVDARENRSFWPAYYIIEEALEKGTEFGPVVIGIGTNSPLDLSVCRRIIELCGDRQVFWITTTNNWQFYNTDKIWQLGEEFENLTVIDWDTCSRGHEDYFYSDGIHLTEEGRAAYTDLVYSSLTDRLFELLPKENHRRYLAGDGYLLACMNDLSLPEGETYVLAEEDLSASLLEKRSRQLYEAGILPENITLVFSQKRLEESDLSLRLTSLFHDIPAELVVIEDTESEPELSLLDSFTVIPIRPEHSDYAEGIHLSRAGSTKLAQFLTGVLLRQQLPGGD